MISIVSKDIIVVCKEKLLKAKGELLNQFVINKASFLEREKGGDEIDQSLNSIAESQFLSNQGRLRSKLLDIEAALARIETGRYGLCEETDEPIQIKRLLAIPWTRLSIEGAELRDDLNKKYARS